MRSLLKALTCMVVLIGIIVLSPVTASAETYTFNNGEITINLGSDWTVYTKDNIKNYQGVLDDELYNAINDIFDNNSFNYKLFSFPPSYDYYWLFSYIISDELASFSTLSDDEIINELANSPSSYSFEIGDVDNLDCSLYKKNGYKYIVQNATGTADGYTQSGIGYATGVGNAFYMFAFYSFDDTPLTSVQKNEIQGVIDNVEYALPPNEEKSIDEQNKDRIRGSMKKGLIKGAASLAILLAILAVARSVSRIVSKKKLSKNDPQDAAADGETESKSEPPDTTQNDLENEKEDLATSPSETPSELPPQTEPEETSAIAPPIVEIETEPDTPVAAEDSSGQFFDLPQDKPAETPVIVLPIAEIETEPDIPITTAHFCRKCGAAIDADAKFCRRCGTEIVDIEKN